MKRRTMNLSVLSLALLVLTLALTLPAAPASAQETTFGLGYGVSVPTGETADFAGGISFRNIGIEARKFLDRNQSVGLSLWWNVLHQEEYATRTDGTVTLTGNMLRTINSFPIYVNYFYYFGSPFDSRPYAGLNAGTMSVERRMDTGVWTSEKHSWRFALSPEVGYMFPAGAGYAFVNAKWQYAFKGGDSPEESYFTFGIGFAQR